MAGPCEVDPGWASKICYGRGSKKFECLTFKQIGLLIQSYLAP